MMDFFTMFPYKEPEVCDTCKSDVSKQSLVLKRKDGTCRCHKCMVKDGSLQRRAV